MPALSVYEVWMAVLALTAGLLQAAGLGLAIMGRRTICSLRLRVFGLLVAAFQWLVFAIGLFAENWQSALGFLCLWMTLSCLWIVWSAPVIRHAR